MSRNQLRPHRGYRRAQADAEKELAELQPRIPRLRVRVEVAAANDVEVTIDDVKITRAMLGVEIPKDTPDSTLRLAPPCATLTW
jgi:hypothetical protein